MTKKQGVNPTKQHNMKCPELYGKKCQCDGYHTFDELYDHRIELFIGLCRKIAYKGDREIWRSKLHADGTSYDGWFILGINKSKGSQITYHLPDKEWENTHFAEKLETAPEFDGHTSDDVLERLKKI